MKTFREMRIGDICYEVNLKGIYQHLIKGVDCAESRLFARISKGGYERDKFYVEDNESVATYTSNYGSKTTVYADIQLAKEKLYEIRNTHITNLHKNMIDAINRYEEACKLLRCYSDCNVPEDIRL